VVHLRNGRILPSFAELGGSARLGGPKLIVPSLLGMATNVLGLSAGVKPLKGSSQGKSVHEVGPFFLTL
jgi:hypothetical protein